MRFLEATLIMAATVWYAAPPVAAQTLRANIPFEFQAGDTSLPAGDYLITVDRAARRVAFTSTAPGGKTGLVFAVEERWKQSARQTGYLVFEKTNGRFLLSRLKPPALDDGWQALPTRTKDTNPVFEREVAMIRLGR